MEVWYASFLVLTCYMYHNFQSVFNQPCFFELPHAELGSWKKIS